jgi:AraC-like DNA-binding protein
MRSAAAVPDDRARRAGDPARRREVRVAASFLGDLAGFLRQRGVDVEAVVRQAGLAPDPAALAEGVPGSVVAAVWHAALARTGDPDLGLHAAEAFTPGALDIVGYVMLSAPTTAEALRLGARYVRLLNDGLALDVARHAGSGPARGGEAGDAVVVCRLAVLEHLDNFVARDAVVGRHVVETVLAGLVRQARLLAERPLVPRWVRFRHPEPSTGAGTHVRVFGTRPAFGAAADEVAFAFGDLAGPVRSANPVLLAAFSRHAEDALAARAAADTLAGRVHAEVVRRLRGEAPPVGAVARALALSARHLQRGLQAEGTTYGEVLDDARRALAERHLAAPGATVAQVGFLLGFSEPSAFQRAFRRWTGTTPGAWRARHARATAG